MTARTAARCGWLIVGLLLVAPAAASEPDPTALTHTRQALRAALAESQNGADAQLRAVIDSPEFGALTSAEQHAALAAAAQVALKANQPERALGLAVRATALPEQGIDDWTTRLRAATRLQNASEEVACATTLLQRWGIAGLQQPGVSVARVNLDAEIARLGEPRLHLLELLYDQRWKEADDFEPSVLWRELSLGLLESGRLPKAQEVASHVTGPYELVAMLADRRYLPILKSRYLQRDVRKAAEGELDERRKAADSNPRSLVRIERLMGALRRLGRDSEALSLADATIHRIDGAAEPPPFDDAKTSLYSLLQDRAEVLTDLGRFDESIAQWKQACDASRGHEVGVCINLAVALVELGRPDEALPLLPEAGALSPYGRTVVEMARAGAAQERGDAATLEGALAYLRAHESDSPAHLQRALVMAGQLDEAAAVLKGRIEDPVWRSEALVELQDYELVSQVPERVSQWRTEVRALRGRDDIQRAIAAVGTIRRYPLRGRF